MQAFEEKISSILEILSYQPHPVEKIHCVVGNVAMHLAGWSEAEKGQNHQCRGNGAKCGAGRDSQGKED